MKRILTVVLCASVALAASAQTVIKVEAPNLVAVDETFNVTFIIEGEKSPSSFEWDQGEDFQLVWGPQKGTSTSVSGVNGKWTKSVQNTYSYLLMAKKPGKFSLPSASAMLSGSQILSKRVSIEVVEADASASAPRGNSSGQDAPAQSGEIMLKWTPSKSNVMIGESFVMTLKLYQTANVTGCNISNFPDIQGFKVEELQTPQQLSYQRENVNGKIWNAALLRSFRFTPERSGDITIGPVELACEISVRTGSSMPGFPFADLIGDDYAKQVRRVTSKSATIHVSPLPVGAPDSFCGALGSYSIKASVSPNSLRSHDAATLKLVVTGEGNAARMEAPKINFPPDFEVFDVKMTEDGNSHIFEYPFIPRSHGQFTIPAIEFSFYNLKTRKYETARTQEIVLDVAKGADIPGASSDAGQLQAGVNKRDVRNLGSDIRFIRSEMPYLSERGKFFAGSVLMWVLALIICIAGAVSYYALRTMASRRSDEVWTRRRSASKMARRKLAKAGEYLHRNLYSAFYEELHKALLGFAADKFGMDASEMSKDNISTRLSEAGVSEGLARDYVSLLDACEYARYSPDSGHEAMNAHYEKAVEVITSIDTGMKRGYRKAGAGAVVAALLMMLPFGAEAQVDTLWNAGVQAYTSGQWTEALDCWTQIESAGDESSDLYFNIGNAFFRTGDNAHAILYYERALKLDPSNSDARFNLEYANSFVQDKIEAVPEFFLKTWAKSAGRLLSADGWALMFILLLAGTVALVLVFLLSRNLIARKLSFYCGIAALLLTISSLCLSLSEKADYFADDTAIVVAAVAPAQSSPGSETSVDLFVLHEGVKVVILDEVGQWCNVQLPDGRKGWILKTNIEII